jgi:hypothetical protein
MPIAWQMFFASSFLATAAVASPIETATLTLTGVNGQQVSGNYVSPYYARLGSQSLTVYCDDVLDMVSVGESWTVEVYSGGDTTGAMFPGADYPALFWLAGQDAPATYITTQEAMWTETDPAFPGATSASNALLATAIIDAGTVDLSDWEVLTPAGSTGQEFLVDSIAPEPISMILAGVGLSGLGLIKRNRVV